MNFNKITLASVAVGALASSMASASLIAATPLVAFGLGFAGSLAALTVANALSDLLDDSPAVRVRPEPRRRVWFDSVPSVRYFYPSRLANSFSNTMSSFARPAYVTGAGTVLPPNATDVQRTTEERRPTTASGTVLPEGATDVRRERVERVSGRRRAERPVAGATVTSTTVNPAVTGSGSAIPPHATDVKRTRTEVVKPSAPAMTFSSAAPRAAATASRQQVGTTTSFSGNLEVRQSRLRGSHTITPARVERGTTIITSSNGGTISSTVTGTGNSTFSDKMEVRRRPS